MVCKLDRWKNLMNRCLILYLVSKDKQNLIFREASKTQPTFRSPPPPTPTHAPQSLRRQATPETECFGGWKKY